MSNSKREKCKKIFIVYNLDTEEKTTSMKESPEADV
jgi:hypothetical protein